MGGDVLYKKARSSDICVDILVTASDVLVL